MSSALAIAEQIDALKGLRTGAFRFWDVLPVRPDDWLWILAGALAWGDRVDLVLVDGMGGKQGNPGTAIIISVWAPRGFAQTDGGFSLSSAEQVKFGTCLIRVDGQQLHIEWDGVERRRVPSVPALVVERRG